MYLSRYIRLASVLFFLISGGCASLPENTDRQESFAFANPESTGIGKKIAIQVKQHPAGQSGFHLLSDGYDAFVARAALAQIAEKSIDSQYYMVHGDMVGTLYVDQLVQAADRGVKVRFLLDDMDEGSRDFGLAKFDMHPNVEVRIFNPFGRNTSKTAQFITGFGKQTRRAHNKSFTVDNAITIVGGRNIGDEYFAAGKEMDFADLDVIGAGPVAREVSASFDQYWNSP
ncbi:MAG TPA: phospholipase D family protein, partial [Gammaproteobacteria bacterium]|nr:phospholipase D family protein [Gammaproteobacteria bacterium]